MADVREDGRAVLLDMVDELNGAGRVSAGLERWAARVSHVWVGMSQ
jgi:predicted component of type VI protein secretion system